MINQIIEYSGRNRAVIIVLVAMLVFAGLWSMREIPLDAIPDLSDPQVIIYTEWPGRSPNLVEDQITYPVISAMLAAPRVSAVRGISDYGFSYVYVIFEEGTDIYWGRSRVLEYMSKIGGKLPEGVSPRLGPDATGVGWAFQYALVDKTGTNNLAQLRSFNDWYMRYWLESVPGVAEVATVGGFVKQYQVNGEGEVTGGIVVVRYGQNVMNVIQAVKQKIEEVRTGLPKGVDVVVTYDRSDLIARSIETLKHTLIEELIIVSVVILIFLWHVPSAIIPIVTIPIAVILSFVPMYGTGITSNIMSLGGIAIAIGAMVDAAIVVVEQTHKKLEHWEAEGRHGSPQRVIIDAVKEVGGPSFFSLLVIAVSFMPIFALQYQEGRLFKPLAFTKNFSMALAAALPIPLVPAMRLLLMRTRRLEFRPRWLARVTNAVLVGRIHSEEHHPISRPLMRVYHPVVRFVLNHKWLVITTALLLVALTVPIYLRLGSEFMPPLNEGPILDMPITLPGISVTEATKYLQIQDKLLTQFPEVQSVFGKIGKSETATDPAPMSMVETTVVLKPEKEWRHLHRDRWYSKHSPEFLKPTLRRFWPEDGPIGWEQLIEEMDHTIQIPTFC